MLETAEEGMGDNLELYRKYWLPFGEILTDMERAGIKVDIDYLRKIELQATKDKKEHEDRFLQWVQSVQPDAQEFNASSIQQLA